MQFLSLFCWFDLGKQVNSVKVKNCTNNRVYSYLGKALYDLLKIFQLFFDFQAMEKTIVQAHPKRFI